MHEHEEVDIAGERLRRGLADNLEEHVATREPELPCTSHHGALDGAREPKHGALHGERAPGVLAGGEDERDARQVARANLQTRADDDALVPPDERRRAVRAHAQLVIHHADAPERRVGAQRGLHHGGHRGVRAIELLVHVDEDVRQAVVSAAVIAGDMDDGDRRC